jgi:Ice-binding-like/Bacterial Ig-like domain
MTRFENSFKSLIWFTALLLAGCGSRIGSESQGLTGIGIGPAPINLGKAGTFAILTKTGMTDVYASAIVGNVGASPITGAAVGLTCGEVVGTIYSIDVAGPPPCTVTNAPFLTSAVSDMESAYTDAAGRTSPTYTELGTGEIGGLTLVPGLYKWGTGVLISTDVTLSGGPNDVWIFQIAGRLTQANATSVTLTGGALAKNVFWQVADAVTIGTTAHFEGIILAQTLIVVNTGASVNGRLLAQTAVTLQQNAVTQPGGAADTTAPTVASTSPLPAATAVLTTAAIQATFSEAMTPQTITAATFTLTGPGGAAVPGSVVFDAPTKVATLHAVTSLAGNTSYLAKLQGGVGGVTDLAGNAMASNYTWSFTTGAIADTTRPTVSSTVPANGATSVATNSAITATFSEAMAPATLTTAAFTMTGPGAATVAGTVTYAGLTATFKPASALAINTLFTAAITTGAKDLAGNALAANYTWSFTTGAHVGLSPVFLGSAAYYVILAKSAISTVPPSAVTGDMALSPAAASYITGFGLTAATGYATAPQVTGKIYAADYAAPTPSNLTTAVLDMQTAYTDAAGRPTPDFLELGTGAIGGLTLAPGLYKWTSTVTIPSDVTLTGSATDVWIFQISGDLAMSSAKHVLLSGGAQARNVFWQVAGAVDIGTNAHFEGIILSQTAISLRTSASMNGRALSQTAVTLDSATVK